MATVNYTIRYKDVKGGSYLFIGAWHVGTIIFTEGNWNTKKPHFAAFINMPGIIGPVAQSPTILEAKIALTSKAKEWLAELDSATPAFPMPRISENTLLQAKEKPLPLRITRTREPKPQPARIRRVRPVCG